MNHSESAALTDAPGGHDARMGAVGPWRDRMTISLIFKIAAVGILVTILSQVLKHSGRDEHAFMISLAGLILVLLWIVPYIYELFETIRQLFAL